MRRVGQVRRRDANESSIVDALRAFGATVYRLSAPGVPDLLVGYKGRWTPLEVKTAKGGFTALQAHAMTSGLMIAPVVRSIEDALRAIGAQR